METALLIGAVLIATLACPAMMWWQRFRGREAACCTPTDAAADGPSEVEQLRRRNESLSARLAELGADPRR